jgi:hypothetical protein
MMTIIDRRLRKLEDRFGPADGRPGRDATCRRTLWSDGTLFERVEFNKHNEGPDVLTDEELDRWLEEFPVY